MSSAVMRAAKLLGVILLCASVSYLIARRQIDNLRKDGDFDQAPPISLENRPSTKLELHTIQPLVAADGLVIEDQDGFILSAPITPRELAYQLLTTPPNSIKALIVGGPAGFDCSWVGLVQSDTGDVHMRCRIPSSIKVIPGLAGTMAVATIAPVEALALQVTAVIGTAGQGQVVVVRSDGTLEARQVVLGVADLFWIEIKSGLDPTETVLAYPVQADLFSSTK